MPAPTTRMSVNRCGVCLGRNWTRKRLGKDMAGKSHSFRRGPRGRGETRRDNTLLLIPGPFQPGELFGELLVRLAVLRRRQGGPAPLDLVVLALGVEPAGADVVQVAPAVLGVGELLVLGGRLGALALEHLLVGPEEFLVLFLRHVGLFEHVLGDFLLEVLQLQFAGLLLVQGVGFAALGVGLGSAARGSRAVGPRSAAGAAAGVAGLGVGLPLIPLALRAFAVL